MAQPVPAPTARPVVAFFGLVFALSGAFYLLGPLIGNLSRWTRADVPASALMFVCPATAAVVLMYRRRGRRGLGVWARGMVRRPRTTQLLWYLPALLLPPLVLGASYLVLRWTGAPLPDPAIAWSALLPLAAIYLVSALAEEIGWSGYATSPLQQRWGPLAAALVIGAVWAAWHIVPHLQTGRSASWIAGQCAFTVLFRVVLVWLYDNAGGGIAAPALCHASYNVAWSSFPHAGSHYHPSLTAVIMAVVVAGIIASWPASARASKPLRRPDRAAHPTPDHASRRPARGDVPVLPGREHRDTRSADRIGARPEDGGTPAR
ncbi:CPBP family intramembrane glutamic endopeptidase [Micromonospora sp. HK10]|uniref:CPBP family intramembrane glutamic endopeptidase n=1 Tax=Micromonospora sp. HK10 TaxID=1538294 RepID=UPI000626F1E3|nr:CPBP family intramembrane glutamic endopeptidase [Micromonospora sp. HK10]KKJ94158.1 hypothetical protein LQ51_28420 [Micromonospora sp. HK10]